MADTLAAETLGALHDEACKRLREGGIAEAGLDSRLLVEHFAGTSRTDAVASPERPVSPEEVRAVRAAIDRRLAGEPVHRILGHREFYGLSLRLSEDTLEPRPDTETLVDLVLPEARRIAAGQGRCRILDLGTGTGAIALALLSEIPEATALGVDISPGAVAIACANADMAGNVARFEGRCSDWFEKVEGLFHIIVSNPPYIGADEWATLPREVRDFDPRPGLDGGSDGLTAYRAIATQAGNHLTSDGVVAVEIGRTQRDAVTGIFVERGFRFMASARDIAGRDRAVMFAA